MSRTSRLAVSFITLLLAAACSAAPSGGSTTPGGQTPAVTAPPTSVATAPPVGGHECDAFPTINPASPVIPSFAPDLVLESKFPTEIDGEPVRDLQSGSYLQSLCFGGQAAVDRIRGDAQFDLLSLTFAQAEATVDGEDVDLQAFRAPGQDAAAIIALLLRMAAQSGTEPAPSLVPGTAGGKSVITSIDADGVVLGYGYGSGDTLFIVDSITQSQADKIFAALP